MDQDAINFPKLSHAMSRTKLLQLSHPMEQEIFKHTPVLHGTLCYRSSHGMICFRPIPFHEESWYEFQMNAHCLLCFILLYRR